MTHTTDNRQEHLPGRRPARLLRRVLTSRPSPGTVLGAVALVVATSGVAYAAIPSSDGTVHSCYTTTGRSAGALRVIDAQAGATCTKSEKPLTFNQTGPQGAQGPKGDGGAPGVQGATGPAGPSDAFIARNLNSVVGYNPTTIVSLDLPAGSYTVSAEIVLVNTTSTLLDVGCTLSSGAEAAIRLAGSGNGSEWKSLALQDVLTLDSAGTAYLQCYLPSSGDATVAAQYVTLIAVSVGTVHS